MAKTNNLNELAESKSIAVWSKHNRRIKTSKGWVPYSVKDFPYLLSVLRSIQDPDVDRVILQCGTQIGKTEAAVSAMFWFLLQRGENCLLMLPHQSALSDMSSSRLNPIIENSPRLKAGFDKVNNVRLKTTKKGSSLYLRAAGSSDAQLEEFNVSFLVRDEFAHYDDKVIELSEKRLGSAENPTIVDLGHPLYSGNRLSAAYGESSQFEWHYACPDCGAVQKIDFFDHFYDRGRELGCPDCGQSWTKDEILSDGFWKALGSPDNSTHGYRIPRTLSPNQDLDEMADKYEDAQSGGGTRIAIFNQTYLAREFSASGQTLSPGEVKAIMTGPSTASVDPENTIMGVDVGKPLFYSILKDNRVLAFGKAESYDELTRVRERWDASICALDAAPEYHKSREWVEDLPAHVRGWLITTQGRGQVHEPKANLEKNQIQIHQVESFDRLFDSVRKKTLQLPSDSPPQVEKHFTTPVKLIEDDKPHIDKGDASHWCDSVRYCQAAQVVSGQVPTPKREKIFDEFEDSHVITELKPLQNMTVGINVTDQNDFAFVLAGLTPKRTLNIVAEYVYDGDKSYSNYDIFMQLGRWLEKQGKRLGQVMQTGGGPYLQPRWLTANKEDFTEEAYKLRSEYAVVIKFYEPDTAQRISQLKALLAKGGVEIHQKCERLRKAINKSRWGEEEPLVLPAVAGILVFLDRKILAAPGTEKETWTNQDKLREFNKIR